MHRNWQEKNVDLELLTGRIGDFFKTKEFEAVKGEIPTGYQIFAQNSPYFNVSGYLSVTIEGKPDDFSVDFKLCTDKEKPDRPHSMLLESMILGGYFISRRLKAEENLLRLEKEFWRHVENAVLQLSNSTHPSH